MARKLSVDELKKTGTWRYMSAAKRQERLEEEGLPMPDDLPNEQCAAWIEQSLKIEALGVPTDCGGRAAFPRTRQKKAASSGDEESYAATLRQFENRIASVPQFEEKSAPAPNALETAKT